MTAVRALDREVHASGRRHQRLVAIARAAVASLHAELVLSPKPGLVCPTDRGSHDDMDAATMMRSLFALRRGYLALVLAAAGGADFARLQAIGIEAEQAMRRATGGVNTHRGALFAIGLLAASAGACIDAGQPLDEDTLRATLRARWGRALRARPIVAATHGREMAMRHGAGGASREAAAGFPTVFDVVLPALRGARSAGLDERLARLQALMTSIATIDDTNLLYRGGADGLRLAQTRARAFLASGGCLRPDAAQALDALGREFVTLRLSPGGSADLLAAALFVDRVVARVIDPIAGRAGSRPEPGCERSP